MCCCMPVSLAKSFAHTDGTAKSVSWTCHLAAIQWPCGGVLQAAEPTELPTKKHCQQVDTVTVKALSGTWIKV